MSMLASQLKQHIEETLLPELVETVPNANTFHSWRLSDFYQVGREPFCNGNLSCTQEYPELLYIGYFFSVELKRRNSNTLKWAKKKLHETIIRVVRDHFVVHDLATCTDPECPC